LVQTASPTTLLTRATVEELSRARKEPEWLLDLRLQAFAAYESLPLSGAATGNWRHASLEGLELGAQQVGGSWPLTARITNPNAPEGRGVRVLDLAEAVHDAELGPLVQAHLASVVKSTENKLTALHYAFLNGGAVVHVPRGVDVEEPIRVDYDAEAGVSAFAHTLVILEESSSLGWLEAYAGESPLASGVVELVLGRNTQLRYVQVQRWGAGTWGFSTQRAKLDADSHLRTLNVALGGKHVQNNVGVLLEGKGSQADLLGLVSGTGRQHVDFQTLQDHYGDNTRSDLVIHNALDDRSSSNFTGLIRINKSSHATESSQEQKNILLSPRAKADSDPQLEIMNNDVIRCTHGASVGPMDPEAIFYLESRGLDHAAAEALVIEGFFQSVMDKLDQPALRAAVLEAVAGSLSRSAA